MFKNSDIDNKKDYKCFVCKELKDHIHCNEDPCTARIVFVRDIERHVKWHAKRKALKKRIASRRHKILKDKDNQRSASECFPKDITPTESSASVESFFNRKRGRPPKNRCVSIKVRPLFIEISYKANNFRVQTKVKCCLPVSSSKNKMTHLKLGELLEIFKCLT